jgi:hypothetical protein
MVELIVCLILGQPVLNTFVLLLDIMVVSNVEILDRQLKQFSANSEVNTNSIKVNAKYVITVQNKGIIPTSMLSLRLKQFTYGSDNKVLSSKNRDIGRLSASSEQTVEFDISTTIEAKPDNLGLIQRSCNSKSVTVSSEEEITGRLFSKSFSKSGGVLTTSNSCSVAQLEQQNNTEPEREPEREPEPEPQPEPTPEPEPQPPQDGENGNDNNQQQDSEIEGPNILSVGQNAQLRWSDFPPDTITFRWQVLAEGESSNEPTTLELAEGAADELILNFVSEAEGDFLIRIIATANGERLEQVQKIVSVIPEAAENP